MPQSTFPGSTSAWNGLARHDFTLDAWKAILVKPRQALPGNPWIWRAQFFDRWPAVDIVLVREGFHLAWINVSGLFGAPEAGRRFDAFYGFLTETFGLAQQVVLEGFSRGGLDVYRWAARWPERVCCIYGDAPVCDFKSWPGAKNGSVHPADWAECLKAYGLTEAEANRYPGNPIDNLAPLAAHGIPIIHVCGDADLSVPLDENTAIVQDRYTKLGGRIEVILKPGGGHHPHSLEDPRPVVDFILSAWSNRKG